VGYKFHSPVSFKNMVILNYIFRNPSIIISRVKIVIKDMKTGINWGIIGCGDVTEIKSGPAFSKVPGSSLIAVMRRDAVKAQDYALRHNVPTWYADASQLISDPQVNAVYIATPPVFHEEYAIASIKAGKPVYVEKPMSTDVAACERMCDMAASNGVKLSVAHYRRALPMFIKIKQMIEEHAIGDIRLVRLSMLQPDQSSIIARTETNWRVDPAIGGAGGLFYDLAPHQLDLMIHFFGPVANSFGVSANQAGLYLAKDIVSGIVHFSNNIIFSGNWCFTVNEDLKEDNCEIIGSLGRISFPLFGNSITVQKEKNSYALSFERPEHIQQPMIEKVVQYFSGEGPNPCSAEKAIESMRLMEKFVSGK
jgi:predicted dehydrogenase